LKRICASSWTIAKNHCMMHGQQNVKYPVNYVRHCGDFCDTLTWWKTFCKEFL